MTPEEFVKGFYIEKQLLLDRYLNSKEATPVSQLIDAMQLDQKGKEQIRQIIDKVLSDGFYTALLGLEGEALIGNRQEFYKLFNGNGEELTGGAIEHNAWEYFYKHKFEIDHSQADFIAQLDYKKEGGRSTPAMSGYRPQIKFDFDDMQTSGDQKFIDKTVVFPGDRVTAAIKILSVDHFANKLETGMEFDFREGSVVIGTGKILLIVNEKLKREVRG